MAVLAKKAVVVGAAALLALAGWSERASAQTAISTDGKIEGTILEAETQFNIGGVRIMSREGSFNLFIGNGAGLQNSGTGNTFVGYNAGVFNNSGGNNTFGGFEAGRNNSSGTQNVYLGKDAGRASLDGSNNVFIGHNAGDNNLSGTQNTIVGSDARLSEEDLINAAAIGYRAFVELDNSLVLGSIKDVNGATEDTYVGIGTSAPIYPLDIETEQTSAPSLRITNYSDHVSLRARSSNGTRSEPTASQTGDALLVIGADGYRGESFSQNGSALIQFSAAEDWTTNAVGSKILFATTANGTTDRSVRLSINENGKVTIGDHIADRKLDVDGIVRVGATSGTIGCVEDRNGTVIAGTCASDSRFKKDIEPFGSVLEDFSSLRPVNYSWRSQEFADRGFGEARSYGLIAQEVEQAFPDLVTTDEEGYKRVNYSKLPLLTIQAVKELKAENDLLRDQLERQLGELRDQLAVIEGLR